MLHELNHPVRIPETPVASIRVEIPRDAIADVMDAAIGELLQTLLEQGVEPVGDLLAYHHRRPTLSFDCELALPVATPVNETGRVKNSVLPAASFVEAVYEGPYDGLPSAWQEFVDGIKNKGLDTDEVFFERYSRSNTPDKDPSTYVTTLYKRLA